MKRKLIAATLFMAAMIGGGAVAVQAGHGPGGEFGAPPPRAEMGPGKFVMRMAKVLKLSDTQKGEIKTILEAEQSRVRPLLEKLRENRKLLMEAGEATTFDEPAVRGIAAAQAQIETELIVARVRAQSQIHALLTAEQRELLKNLMPDMERQPPLPPAIGGGE